MIIGYIKGHDVCKITNKKIEKKDFLNELAEVDDKIKDKLKAYLNNGAYIIGLTKKKILKCVYIFKMEKETKTLIFSEKISTMDITEEIDKQFEKIIVEELKDKVTWGELSKVDWNDVVIVPNEKSGFSSLTFSTCLALGLLYGIVFNNLSMGLLFGVGIGLCFGSVVKKKS